MTNDDERNRIIVRMEKNEKKENGNECIAHFRLSDHLHKNRLQSSPPFQNVSFVSWKSCRLVDFEGNMFWLACDERKWETCPMKVKCWNWSNTWHVVCDIIINSLLIIVIGIGIKSNRLGSNQPYYEAPSFWILRII